MSCSASRALACCSLVIMPHPLLSSARASPFCSARLSRALWRSRPPLLRQDRRRSLLCLGLAHAAYLEEPDGWFAWVGAGRQSFHQRDPGGFFLRRHAAHQGEKLRLLSSCVGVGDDLGAHAMPNPAGDRALSFVAG